MGERVEWEGWEERRERVKVFFVKFFKKIGRKCTDVGLGTKTSQGTLVPSEMF